MDSHRWQRRLATLLPRLGDRTSGTTEGSADPTDRLAVWSEVDRLPPRQRHVLYLRYRADLSFEDVGGALGITANAARSHCAAAMSTLRRRFADPGDNR